MRWKLGLALAIVVIGVPTEANLLMPHFAIEVGAENLPVVALPAEIRSITKSRVHVRGIHHRAETQFWQTSDDDGWFAK